MFWPWSHDASALQRDEKKKSNTFMENDDIYREDYMSIYVFSWYLLNLGPLIYLGYKLKLVRI